jgi:hypothetical protein
MGQPINIALANALESQRRLRQLAEQRRRAAVAPSVTRTGSPAAD